jgi:hypothetical protein
MTLATKALIGFGVVGFAAAGRAIVTALAQYDEPECRPGWVGLTDAGSLLRHDAADVVTVTVSSRAGV